MKLVIQIILVLVVINFSIGFYLLYQEHPKGDIVVGIGVLLFSFVLMPLFLYHRYRSKKMKDYMLDKDKMNQIIDNLNL